MSGSARTAISMHYAARAKSQLTAVTFSSSTVTAADVLQMRRPSRTLHAGPFLSR